MEFSDVWNIRKKSQEEPSVKIPDEYTKCDASNLCPDCQQDTSRWANKDHWFKIDPKIIGFGRNGYIVQDLTFFRMLQRLVSIRERERSQRQRRLTPTDDDVEVDYKTLEDEEFDRAEAEFEALRHQWADPAPLPRTEPSDREREYYERLRDQEKSREKK